MSDGISLFNRAWGVISFRPTTTGLNGVDEELLLSSDDVGKGPLGLNMLNSPSDPAVDLIFVHGLRGGSRSSWSKSAKPEHYWPNTWLPTDPDFCRVRIHAFGHKSDWKLKQDSTLDINDFSLSLLGELQDSPYIRQGNTRIVFVGHSMGGIVVKQLCILAGQNPAFASLRERFDSVYFLGTPHLGVELVKTLGNIVKAAYGKRRYLQDLQRNSNMILSINDGFLDCATGLKIWSFYETLPTKLYSLVDVIIVDKNSATLGHQNERVALLNADHRGLNKFETPNDSNYRTLRNALSSTVADIVYSNLQAKIEAERDSHRRLKSFLGVDEKPEDDLLTIGDMRIPGSCEWLTSKKEFTDWSSVNSAASSNFWLIGNPASGKSVLASFVVSFLRRQNLDVSYFFFKHGISGKRNASDCLRSLAHQMLISRPEFRKRLLALEAIGVGFNKNDEKEIWRKIFRDGDLTEEKIQPQYWVIDALDECSQSQNLVSMLSKMEDCSPIRVFVTSRRLREIESVFEERSVNVQIHEITISDTIYDIKAYIYARIPRLPVGDIQIQNRLMERILEKSQGSFLWVRLVIQQLERTWSEEAVEDVLNDIPNDMNHFYLRTVEAMSQDRRSAKLAVSILNWTVCASKPLNLAELYWGIKLDTNETVSNLERSIASTCGQLVFVDQASTVHLIHLTARAFLLQPNLQSEFAINHKLAHLRLALACLSFLGGDYLKTSRSKRVRHLVDSGPSFGDPSAFAMYACTHFSDHILETSAAEQELIDGLHNFFTRNILHWIEYITRKGKLHHLMRSAANLELYITHLRNDSRLSSYQIQTVEVWIADLIRVTSKFKDQLLACPSSIHSVVLPMCPRESTIAKNFTSPHRGLNVKGIKWDNWDDCFAQIDLQGDRATAIAHGSWFFCVGQEDGTVTVYEKVSCQVFVSFNHARRVSVLSFGAQDKVLASSCFKAVQVWDIQKGSLLWQLDTPYKALSLAFQFNNEHLLVATQGNYVLSWELSNDGRVTRIPWNGGHEPVSALDERRCASLAVFSPDLCFLAISCRGNPVLLFDLESETLVGHLMREYKTASILKTIYHYHVASMAFNPSLDIGIVIVSYGHGELALFDQWSLEVRQRLLNVNATTMACSPDGRTLATGSAFGVIKLFRFEGAEGGHLTPLHQINTQEESIKSLVFSNDNFRFLDIQGTQCRIWQPAILLPTDESYRNEISKPLPLGRMTTCSPGGDANAEITAMICHPDGGVIFCGRQDGSIASFSTRDGFQTSLLYSHGANTLIVSVAFSGSQNIIASVDQATRIIIASIEKQKGEWVMTCFLVDRFFSNPVFNLVISAAGDRLLVCGRESMEIWTRKGDMIGCLDFAANDQYLAISHPLQLGNLIIIGGGIARVYNWEECKEIQQPAATESSEAVETGNSARTVTCHGTSTLALFITTHDNGASNQLLLFPTPTTTTPLSPLPGFANLGSRIIHIISLVSTRLLVLSRDLWVCSIDITTFPKTQQMKRHFFIPSNWPNSSGRMHFHLTSVNEFVFAKMDECVVINRGLDFEETVLIGRGRAEEE